ncbi:MAG: type II toxin-antitoxin system RelE/ParE family toxin [Methanothrix sp.]|nr:type II toxin-antitoxin system RelE/ParE family toxin [Methanothrix sp.]
MVAYSLIISKKALKYLEQLPEIVRSKCKTLSEDPFPGKHGDKELIHRSGHEDIYRLHVGRSYTVFYKISKNEKIVKILEVTTIERAHKLYGRSGGLS